MLHTGYQYCTSLSNALSNGSSILNLSSEFIYHFDFQPKNEIDEFKLDIEQQHPVATKHKLSINRPGNSINQSVYFTMTQYFNTTQKGTAKIVESKERGLCMVMTMVSVDKVKIK